jgi:hypothetical protein
MPVETFVKARMLAVKTGVSPEQQHLVDDPVLLGFHRA